MCGIAGYTHFKKRFSKQILTTALNSLVHRGPDHQGRFECAQVSLGATRLRILDLQDGDQPVISDDGNVVVVFNGEIFNHRELRRVLSAEGFSFKTECDTEVVLNAFLCWGKLCFQRFRGMFAVAIWTQSERSLVLARDRMGIKPLYYRLDNDEISFGSELKCILADPEVPRKLSLSGLDCFLSLNYVPGPLTLVEGINKVKPGQMLEFRNQVCRVEDYIKPPAGQRVINSIDDACVELDGLLTQAVTEQLVSDRPIGIWLSGGLDSSTILHYAAQAQSSQLRTFSVTFKGCSDDESKYIAEVSKHYGTDHYEVDLDQRTDLVDAIEHCAYYSDEPNGDAGVIPTWFLSRLTRDHATVALSGEGSDELFAGYLTYKADRYRVLSKMLPVQLRNVLLRCASYLPASDVRIGFDYKLKRFLQGCSLSAGLAHGFWNGTFSEVEKRSLSSFGATGALAQLMAEIPESGTLQRFLDFDQRYYLPDDILCKVDRISMAHSIEVRPPFLDSRIVDFAARLPFHFKLRGTTSKYVLRRTMNKRLPASVLRRPKIGFDIPVHSWFRGVLRPFLLDTLSQDAAARTGLFHWPEVERVIGRHLERKENLGYHLWGLLTLFIWMQRWKIEPPAAVPIVEPTEACLEELRT